VAAGQVRGVCSRRGPVNVGKRKAGPPQFYGLLFGILGTFEAGTRGIRPAGEALVAEMSQRPGNPQANEA